MGERAYNRWVDTHPSIRSHWHTTELSPGTIVDTPGSNDGTSVNFTAPGMGLPGLFPGSRAFDAALVANSHVTATSVTPVADQSYGIWFTLNAKGADNYLMGHQADTDNRFALFTNTTGGIQIAYEIGNVIMSRISTTLDLQTGTAPHSVIFTINSAGNTLNLYLDGVLDQDAQSTVGRSAGTTNLFLGGRTTTGVHNGLWSHPAIWDTELSAAEVLTGWNEAQKIEDFYARDRNLWTQRKHWLNRA